MRFLSSIAIIFMFFSSCTKHGEINLRSKLYLTLDEIEEAKYLQITAYEERIYAEMPIILVDTVLESSRELELSIMVANEGRVFLRTASWYGWLYIIPGEELYATRHADGNWVFGEGKLADYNRFFQEVNHSSFAFMHRALCALPPDQFLDTLLCAKSALESQLESISSKYGKSTFSEKMNTIFEDQLYEYLYYYPDYHKNLSGLEMGDFPQRDSILSATEKRNEGKLWSETARTSVKKNFTAKVLDQYPDASIQNKDSLSWKLALKESDETIKEFLLATLIAEALDAYHYELAIEMLNQFESFFPNSKYLRVLEIHVTQKASFRNGAMMKDFCGLDLEGNQRCLSELKGKVVLVDTWATWCGPCIESFPKVLDLRDQFQDQGLEVLFVNMDDDYEKWKNFALKNPRVGSAQIRIEDPWQSAFSRDNNLLGIPYYVLLDRDGKRLHTGLTLPNVEVIENSLNMNMD